MKKARDPNAPPAWTKKTLAACIDRFFEENCPGLGGALTREPVVKAILALIDTHLLPADRLRPGQMLWFAVDENETAGYGKPLERSKMRPVILDLIDMGDVDDYLAGIPKRQRQTKTAVRLFSQAKDQGGVLTHADVAAMMRLAPGTISRYIVDFERENNTPVPRRGNIHDMGPTLTHKRIICQKHFVEGKTIGQTARETRHSPAAVTRYTHDFKRVRACLVEDWNLEKTAFATGLSKRLVNEYFDILKEKNNATKTDDDLPF